MTTADRVDVIVVGGGPAGLSAALVLARARRRVVVLDAGHPRNATADALHGFLTRDGIPPRELLEIGRAEARRYGVDIRAIAVKRAFRERQGFGVDLAGGGRLHGRRLLIATGVEDRIPALKGILDFYGKSVHHCPYCDGWEWRDRPLAAYGRGSSVAALAHSLRSWSADLVVCTDGPARLGSLREPLERRGIQIREDEIARLEGRDGRLEHVAFVGGEKLPRSALFFSTGNDQACRLGIDLGCRVTSKGSLWASHLQATSVAGVFVAGDASRDAQFVVVAAAEGAKAAVAINAELQAEEREGKALEPTETTRPERAPAKREHAPNSSTPRVPRAAAGAGRSARPARR